MGYRETVLRDRPFGYWPLDDAQDGTVARGWGPAGNATYTATGVTKQINGPGAGLRKGVRCDGSTGHITLPSLNTWLGQTAQQTWEIWAHKSTLMTVSANVLMYLFDATVGATPQVIGLGGNFTGSASNEIVSLGNYNAAQGQSYITGAALTIPIGWHHYVFTYMGVKSGWRFFMDGAAWLIKPGSAEAASNGGSNGMQNGTFTIANSLSSHETGSFAGVAFYNYRLSEGAIRRHYLEGRVGTMGMAA